MTNDDAGQVLPMGPVQKAIRAQSKRLSLLQEQVDALSSLENATRERLDAIYGDIAYLKALHSLESQNAVNAKETRQEAERHA